MFMLNNIPISSKSTIYYLKNNFVLLIISIIGATPIMKNIISKFKNTKYKGIIDFFEVVGCITLLILATAFLIDESFNPFLYFRF